MPQDNSIIRILVVDDHPMLREGIKSLLRIQKDMEVVGEASNGTEAIEKARLLEPDVILLDLIMPEMDGFEAIQEINDSSLKTRILVLTSFTDDEKVFRAIRAGALGYILKDSDPNDLLRAIRNVNEGHHTLAPTIAHKLMNEISGSSNKAYGQDSDASGSNLPAPIPLTSREMDVLQLTARGMSNREISEHLELSEATTRSHVSSILAKLHLSNRTQAVLYALRKGMVELEPDDLE